jgi:hypothetical protein
MPRTSGARPVGTITRGTTHPNRLRRVDRWIVGPLAPTWRAAEHPVVVDLGYGANPVTAVELLARLRRVRPDVAVVGVEIDPARVAAAQNLATDGLTFVRGGFELPLPDDRRAVVVRAFNVLRQYEAGDVEPAWAMVRERLAPDGVLIDGTCDELGRRASWVTVSRDGGPRSLTLSLRLTDLTYPSEVAERLPKVLIHRNVPGERVHAFLGALDEAWARSAPLSVYGPRQRFVATIRDVRDGGWPVLGTASRWRLGEVGVPWESVAPG